MPPELERLMITHVFASRYGWAPEVTENLDAVDAGALLVINREEQKKLRRDKVGES